MTEHGHNFLDHLSIQNCLHSYLLTLDEGNSNHFANLFHEDGYCEVVNTNIFKRGRKELAEFCTTTHNKFPTAVHFEANLVIEFESASLAKNRSYWQAIETGNIVSYGKHEDILEKQLNGILPYQGTWLIKSRKITVLWRRIMTETNVM